MTLCVKNNGGLMEILNSIDDLKIYRGDDYPINEFISIKQPTLGQICEYGDRSYYRMVYTLCSVGADLKWQLDDIGIDYTQIQDFDLFCLMLSKDYNAEKTKILFGDCLDFSKMHLLHNTKLDENVLAQFYKVCPKCGKKEILNENPMSAQIEPSVCDDCQEEMLLNSFKIDRYVYASMIGVIRKIHRIKRNDEVPGNEATRKILIEDARDEYEENKNKSGKSHLLSLISTMVNSEGFKRNDQTVFDMKINAFMDSVARIGKIKNAGLLLQSGYSGFGIDLKKLNKEETNWMGDLD